jgi:hypothetical protein
MHITTARGGVQDALHVDGRKILSSYYSLWNHVSTRQYENYVCYISPCGLHT